MKKGVENIGPILWQKVQLLEEKRAARIETRVDKQELWFWFSETKMAIAFINVDDGKLPSFAQGKASYQGMAMGRRSDEKRQRSVIRESIDIPLISRCKTQDVEVYLPKQKKVGLVDAGRIGT